MLEIERYRLVAASRRVIDPIFLELAAHEHPDRLRERIQSVVDGAEGKGYAAVLLGYGLCGNALAGIRARNLPLVLPRAHDCCTILLGSGRAFIAEFGDGLSASFSSCGYAERGAGVNRRGDAERTNGFDLSLEALVKKYGEANAVELWGALHPEERETVRRFIETAETASLGRSALARLDAERKSKDFRLIRGDSRLLRALVDGPWDAEDFLVVRPGESVHPLYDFERVMEAKAPADPLGDQL